MNRPRTSPSPTGGFTLVELLVTLVIVAILASLLLPALARSRATAWAAECTGSLRQFGLAAQLYWDDNEGRTFAYRGEEIDGGDVYWFGWMSRGEEGQRAFDPTRGVLWSYLADRQVARCPALRTESPQFKAKAAGGACGYGYNLLLSPVPARPTVRPLLNCRPSELTVFADAGQVNDFQPPASPDRPMLEEFYYVNPDERTAHFRHAHRALVVFADGHVDRVAPAPGSIDPRLPAARVGRLPARLLEP